MTQTTPCAPLLRRGSSGVGSEEPRTGNVDTFQFLLKLGPFRRTLKRVVNISQKHSGLTQLKSKVTQPEPFNTIQALESDTSSARVSQCRLTDASHPTAQNTTPLPKRCFNALSSCGVVRATCRKKTCGDSLVRSSKNALRPDVPGQQREGGFRIFHLSFAQTSLESKTRCWSAHVALYWRVSLGSVPSSSQSMSSANPLQNHYNWQCTNDHSAMSNPQLSSKA